MILSNKTYVPAIRWRQGEYQALLRLKPETKDRVVPFITIPPIEFDFEAWAPKKTVHEHVHPFVLRYQKKWNSREAWIGLDESIALGRMSDGTHVFDYIFDGLRKNKANAIPAIPLAADEETKQAVRRAVLADGHGLGIALRIEDLMKGNPRKAIRELGEEVGCSFGSLDLIIDLGAPNFEPYDSFANALMAAMKRLGDLNEVRTLVLLSTAIPETFASIAKGTDNITRHDWLFFKRFIELLPSAMRKPLYGDHTIVHPKFTAMDMRKLKPAGKVIYATPSTWVTRKGGSFRDNPAQMHDHCAKILSDPAFSYKGSSFSYGDEYIAECATKAKGSSTLGRWKEVGINHHITTVANDLANLSVAP